MKLSIQIKKSTLVKIIRFLKWTKIAAKLAAIGSTVSGAVAALSGSATTGMALSAAGATTYAASNGLPQNGYEKTRHIPPGKVNKQANMLRKREMELALIKEKNVEIAKPVKTSQGLILSAKPSAKRSAMKPSAMCASASLARRKK